MDSIYDIEWPMLGNSKQKAILLIMRRTMVPIEFHSVYIVTMNLNSFVAVSIIQFKMIMKTLSIVIARRCE